MESLEQPVERVAPVGVAPADRALAPLERGGLEEPAVQKRQAAQCASRGGALGGRPIQGAEAQRIEHLAVEVVPAGDGLIETVDQIAAVAVQPALRLLDADAP